MRKVVFLLSLVILFFVGNICLLAESTPGRWVNVCDGSAIAYCTGVGKNAYNNDSNPITIRGLKIGVIVGAAWIEEGATISPAGGQLIFAPRNAYYYIIDDGASDQFLRECSQINAESEGKEAE